MARLITLIGLRLKLSVRSIRGTGVADTSVGVIMSVLGVAVSIGLAFAMGALATRSVSFAEEDVIRVAFLVELYTFAFIAIVMPAILGRGSQSFRVRKLALFPISQRSLLGLNLLSGATSGSHLLWYPALVAVTMNAVLTAPRAPMLGLTVIMMLAILFVVWSQCILLLLEALMRQRSVKELVMIVLFVILIGTSLIPAMVDSGVFGAEKRPVFVDILLEIFRPVAELMPPTLVAEYLTSLHMGTAFSFAMLATVLTLWIAAGMLISFFVLGRILYESSSGSTHRPRSARLSHSHLVRLDPWAILPASLAAIAAKELRYQLRSTPGKLALLVAPVFVVMISLSVGKLMFAKKPLFGIEPSEYAFYGVLLYAAVLTSNFLVNAFAWEGPGIKSYLLSPASSKEIIFGKNIGVWLFNLIILTECLLLWSVIKGLPRLSVTLNGIMIFSTFVLMLSCAGNFISIRFPIRRSIASLSNSASQIGTVLMFGSIAVTVLVTGFALVLGLLTGGALVQLGLLSLVVALLAIAYWRLLAPAADLYDEHYERLMDAVEGEA